MSNKTLKILIIDDHQITIEGYKSIIKSYFKNKKNQVIIEAAINCDQASNKLKKSDNNSYDLILLDINLPASADKRFLSGEDLGQEIRKLYPSTSLMIITMLVNKLRLLNILRNLNPEAFLIKNDIDSRTFLEAITKVTNGLTYYSDTIIEVMRKKITSELEINENDRKILFYLSEGVRTKDLIKKVPLSLASIEKRKSILKKIFEVDRKGDLALIIHARKNGFI